MLKRKNTLVVISIDNWRKLKFGVFYFGTFVGILHKPYLLVFKCLLLSENLSSQYY